MKQVLFELCQQFVALDATGKGKSQNERKATDASEIEANITEEVYLVGKLYYISHKGSSNDNGF